MHEIGNNRELYVGTKNFLNLVYHFVGPKWVHFLLLLYLVSNFSLLF